MSPSNSNKGILNTLLHPAHSLNGRFLFATTAGLLTTSLIFLLLFLGLYRGQLKQERADASEQVNRLLQTSLENAMLKRDLAGLGEIVARLGEQQGIHGVMILNPAGEVRFASDAQYLGHRFARDRDPSCTGCHADRTRQRFSLFTVDHQQHEVLRSVNPVPNRSPCIECHGPIEDKPINGILVVDYDAASIRRKARATTLLLMASGAMVVLINIIGGLWFMRRFVLQPVAQLAECSHALGEGDLTRRAALVGRDELAQLGTTFNRMAERLDRTLGDLKENEAYLQALIDADPDAIRVIDDAYRIVTANAAYRELVGMDGEAMGGLCYRHSYQATRPCPRTLITCPVVELAERDQPLRTLQQHQNPAGAPYPVEIYAAPLVINGRRLVVESIRDLRREVRFSHENRLASLGQLAAGVGHEIRNPLGSIRLALQGLRAEQEPENINEYLQLVEGEIDRCIDVAERLLRLSNLPGERPTLVEVNRAIAETLSLLAREGESRDIRIEQRLVAPSPRIIADDSDLRMVVLNLVQNAFFAMPQGGRLEISSRLSEGEVELRFADNGIGMDVEKQQRIFEPFFSDRADHSHGSGLGLPIVLGIVKRYGGRIEVISEAGEGSCFRLLFASADCDKLQGGEVE